MKCMNCGKEFKNSSGKKFCTQKCYETYRAGHQDARVLVICTKVPEIYPELRPRLGEAIVANKKVGYNSTNYLTERCGKLVLLRSDEVMEVAR